MTEKNSDDAVSQKTGSTYGMTEDWTIEFEGFEFAPIPQSWLAHPHAEDRERHEGPRLFAVSAATYGRRTLKVRYGEPRTGEVLVLRLPACEHDTGVVPEGLVAGDDASDRAQQVIDAVHQEVSVDGE